VLLKVLQRLLKVWLSWCLSSVAMLVSECPCVCVCAQVLLPPSVPPSLGFFRADGSYLINNGQVLVVWLGRDLSATWLTQVGRSSSSTAASSTRHCFRGPSATVQRAVCLSVMIVGHAQPASQIHNAPGWRVGLACCLNKEWADL
jgi:hypothetical protein